MPTRASVCSWLRSWLALLALLLAASPVRAQDHPHVFVDAGAAWLVDQAPRLGGGEMSDTVSHGPLIAGGVFVTRHLALGVEWLRPHDVAARAQCIFCFIDTSERENTLTGTIRGRITLGGRATLEPVGGLGRFSATIETTFNDSYFGSPIVTTTTVHATKLAVVGGADVPVHVLSHLDLSGAFHVYWLTGDNQPSDPDLQSERSILQRSSVRLVWAALVRLH
jgi:hypothetical protein